MMWYLHLETESSPSLPLFAVPCLGCYNLEDSKTKFKSSELQVLFRVPT